MIEFIDNFSEVKTFFLNGACYWFAKILSIRFAGSIYYLPISNHFVCKIKGDFYDANGIFIPDEEPILWKRYEQDEPLDASRVRKNCIDWR